MSDAGQQFDQIISAFCALDAAVERGKRIKEIKRQLTALRSTCGSCRFWMCSGDCPAEWNDNGRNRGPSMSSQACGKFSIKAYDADIEQKLKAELLHLEGNEAKP